MSTASAYVLAGQVQPNDLVERYAPLVKKIANQRRLAGVGRAVPIRRF